MKLVWLLPVSNNADHCWWIGKRQRQQLETWDWMSSRTWMRADLILSRRRVNLLKIDSLHLSSRRKLKTIVSEKIWNSSSKLRSFARASWEAKAAKQRQQNKFLLLSMSMCSAVSTPRRWLEFSTVFSLAIHPNMVAQVSLVWLSVAVAKPRHYDAVEAFKKRRKSQQFYFLLAENSWNCSAIRGNVI